MSYPLGGSTLKHYHTGPVTERLEHRSLVPSEAEAFYRLNSHPEVMRLTGEDPIPSVAAANKAIEEYPDFDSIGYGRWGCLLKGEDSIIGFCGLKYLEEFDEVDLGYRFLPEHWGKGLATEACRASLHFGFEELGLNYMMATVLPNNGASIRVLEKINMQYERPVETEGIHALRYGIHRPPH